MFISRENPGMSPFIVAVSGKGGTGKTSISALLIRALIDSGRGPVLAVDSDPNANLHEALGIPVGETLGSMREETFSRHIPPGMNRHDYLRYRFRQVLVEAEGFDLVAMGRPEGHGCYCFANDILRECMEQLGHDYRFIVIDTEAGMEHISRGTIGQPDLLLIVSDPGARGLRTVPRIRAIATQLGLPKEHIHIIVNRFKQRTAAVDTGDEHPIAIVPYDRSIESADVADTPVSLVPMESPARIAIYALAEKITELAQKKFP